MAYAGSVSMDSPARPLGALEYSRYWAFISCSHKGAAHARRLHQAIERYRATE
jgi:hypothetical protein